jgi:acyl-CoA thioesterase-2
MLARLAITNIANCDVYTGKGIRTTWGRLYGGQAVTQSLMAAQETVENTDLHVHSLHGYFILAGDPKIPILFTVDRVRDGRSMATRMVKALQRNRCIFQMIVSFHRDEIGPSYNIPLSNLRGFVAAEKKWRQGNEIPTPQFLLKNGVSEHGHNNNKWVSVIEADGGGGACWRCCWMKYNLTDNDLEVELTRSKQYQILCYMSDMMLVGTVRKPHGDIFSMSISLDHTVYFHRKFDPSRWLLVYSETSTSSGARGIARSHVYQLPESALKNKDTLADVKNDARLVATFSQEALIRVPKNWQESASSKL